MNYNRLADRVLLKLTKYGRKVTLRQVFVGGDYDPATQTASSVASVVDTVRTALVTDQPSKRIGPQYGVNLKAGTLIQDGEKWVYLDAKGAPPKIQDRMVIGEVEYAIVDVQSISPGEIPVVYLVVLRL